MNAAAQVVFVGASMALCIGITLYWILSSRRNSSGHRGNEIFSFIKLIGSCLLIYLPALIGGPFAIALFQPCLATGIIGLIFCLAGFTIMVWGRQHLGKNWSGNVILQNGHQLVKSGPYKYVRHPIYSGGLLAMMGSATILGMVFGFVWVLFCTFGLVRKMHLEEKILSAQFPAEYIRYRRQSKMFVPFIW
jgi:protein-S-isoprenylcysteine O-methyltransferase Ste14